MYFYVAAGNTVGIWWYLASLDEWAVPGTGRCDLGSDAVIVTVIVARLVMPVVMILGEVFAHDRPKRDGAET